MCAIGRWIEAKGSFDINGPSKGLSYLPQDRRVP
jgi:hypothetical protein